MTDRDLAAEVTEAVDARLAQRLADAERRREDRRADRARRAAARTAGLRARHATKLARTVTSAAPETK